MSCTGPLARGWSGRTSNLINTETRDKTTCDGCSCQVWLRSVAHAQAKPASLDRRASTCSRLAVRYECSARERWKDCQLWHTGRISQPSFGTHPLLKQSGNLPPSVCISNGHGASTYGSAVEDSHVCWWGIVCNPSSVAVG